jgi:TRAP-type mannitol/chloroaromatic compound transport system permease small subunit
LKAIVGFRVMAACLDRLLSSMTTFAAWLALPVVATLFLQWPLRDVARCCSREANDLGQWLFALYIAVAVTAATRACTHMAADARSKAYRPSIRAWIGRAAILIVTLPFAVGVGILAFPAAIASLLRLETFGDTGNPGYFIIKGSVVVLTLLMAVQAVISLVLAQSSGPDSSP